MQRDPQLDQAAADDAPQHPRQRSGNRLVVAAVVVLAVVLGMAGCVRYADDVRESVATVVADEPMVVGDRTVLDNLWRVYTENYLEEGTGRTLDPQLGNITTSEGQSYTMMRAVWSDDLATFTSSWQWTKDNLQRPDSLMSWKFGERPDGSYGIQTDVGGQNTASDADSDIAFALLMAYSRWKQDVFLYDALPIIDSIWEKEVVEVDGAPVLVANDLERIKAGEVLVNPSYFSPYAYRVFARVDPDADHDWAALVDNSYAVLQDLAQDPLDVDRAAGLTPDWVFIDRETGEPSAVSDTLTTNFSYDALRLPWRLALDLRWHDEPRARELLEQHSVLAEQWTADRQLVAGYRHDGTPAVDYEAPAMYGGAMGYFDMVEPELAEQVYAEELLPVYDADTGNLAQQLGYYDSNWVWFGMALHLGALPDLTVTDG